MSNQKGFTLIEMLIVLTIVSVLTFIAIPRINELIQAKEMNYFLEQFREDMLYAQQYAMVRKVSVAVLFYPYQSTYRITEGNTLGRVLLRRTYSANLEIQPATLQSPLMFLKNGNVNKSGTILITNGEQTYKIVFLLGKGRFYVQKI